MAGKRFRGSETGWISTLIAGKQFRGWETGWISTWMAGRWWINTAICSTHSHRAADQCRTWILSKVPLDISQTSLWKVQKLGASEI